MSRRFLIVAVVIGVGLVSAVTACGGDGDDAEVLAAYCDYSNSLDADAIPTDEQFDELVELAPSQIQDDVEAVAAELKEKGQAAFQGDGSDEFFASLEALEAFEEENCGRDDPETG